MSIKRIDFINGNFEKKKNTQAEHPIVLFLKENKDTAFKVREIVKGTKVKEDACRSMLSILRKKKKVLHKVPYFTWK